MSKKPTKFDYNLIVIGAGSAGLVSSYIAATVKAKVAIIEKHKMGGDCLNTGCVPSKALIKTANVLHSINNANKYGIHTAKAEFKFSDVMQRVDEVIKKIEPHDSVDRYTNLGVDCIEGEAFIRSPWEVDVNGKILTTKNIIIATGARPFVPPIQGLEDIPYYTSDNLWEMQELPKRLVILGGGPIGSELTQAFSRLGSNVTQIEMQERILAREDNDVSELITKQFELEGVQVLTEHKAISVANKSDAYQITCEHKRQKVEIEFDAIIVAVGRQPNIKGFGLEELGIELNKNKAIKVDPYLRSSIKNIFACGDVAGPYQFTHTAAHQAWFASVNALFGRFKKFKVDYSVIPWATFVDPEVARVGLNETEAKEQGIDYDVTIYGIDDLDRAIADSSDQGFIKVLTEPCKDKIIGATIVGNHAGDLITEYITAMKQGYGMNNILSTIHIYPTLAEANKFAAGNWKKARAPEKLLNWVKKYHDWSRK